MAGAFLADKMGDMAMGLEGEERLRSIIFEVRCVASRAGW